MTNRYIDLNQYDADPRVMAWMQANGIDPNNAPAAQYAQVAGNHLILQVWKLGEDGHKLPVHDDAGEVCAWQKQTVDVPLLSAPEDHGL